MSDARKRIFHLAALPDWAVLTDQQTSRVLGLSLDTLRRLDRGRDGPPRVELSPRRHGRPVGELRKWIQKRVRASLHEPKMRARAGSPDRKASHTADGAGGRTQKLIAKGQSRTTPWNQQKTPAR
jgi:hypothetical protein